MVRDSRYGRRYLSLGQLLEYCLAVPANRLGYGEFSGFQLKIIQEVITLIIFIVFVTTFLQEKLAWNFYFLGSPHSFHLLLRHQDRDFMKKYQFENQCRFV